LYSPCRLHAADGGGALALLPQRGSAQVPHALRVDHTHPFDQGWHFSQRYFAVKTRIGDSPSIVRVSVTNLTPGSAGSDNPTVDRRAVRHDVRRAVVPREVQAPAVREVVLNHAPHAPPRVAAEHRHRGVAAQAEHM
jgi:hypothetical protein